MSGGRNDDVVQVFLDEKNRNGAEEFAVVFMGAMMSWGTNKNFTWMSFPMNMYAAVGSPDCIFRRISACFSEIQSTLFRKSSAYLSGVECSY